MRVRHLKLLLAVAAIAHATKAKTTTSVAGNSTKPFGDSISNADRDDGERVWSTFEPLTNVIKEKILKPFIGNHLEKMEEKPQYVDKTSTSSTENLGDKAFAQSISRAKTKENLEETALKSEEAQVKYWLDRKESPHDSFGLLGLTEAKDNLLAHPLFHYWSTYVERFNKEYPQEKLSVVNTLTPKYYSNADLARLIVDAKKDLKSESNAKELEEAQMKYWLDSDISAHDSFGLLGLIEAKDNLLAHPLFHYWSTYVERFNKEYPDAKTSVAKSLPSILSKEDLTRLLDDAVTKTNLKSKSEVDDLCVKLGLDMVGDGLFTNPLFIYWRTCLEKFNKANTKRQQKTSVVQSLTNAYGDKVLEELIQAQVKGTDSAKYAESLWESQRIGWLNNGKSLGDVFGYLGLDKEGYKMLKEGNPLMDKFITFGNIIIKNREDVTKMPASLSSKEKWVNQGIKFASDEGGLKISQMEQILFRMWFTQGKNPKDIFKTLFGRDKNGRDPLLEDNLFEIPLFVTFLKYAYAFPRTAIARRPPLPKELKLDPKKPEAKMYDVDPETGKLYVAIKVNVALMMMSRFDGELDRLGGMILSAKLLPSKSTQYAARQVENELFRFWTNRVEPNYLWSFLKLDPVMTPQVLFKNRMFHWWMDYMDFYPNGYRNFRSCLTEKFKSKEDVLWLKKQRMTDAFAQKVWTELENQHFSLYTPPKSFVDDAGNKIEGINEILHLSDKIPDDKKILDSYKEKFEKRKETEDNLEQKLERTRKENEAQPESEKNNRYR